MQDFVMRSDSAGQSQYKNEPAPARGLSYVFAYYFYFKGYTTLERALPGSRKT